MTSLYETNVLHQPDEWKRLLTTSLPQNWGSLRIRRVILVGIGSSYWAARFVNCCGENII
jgi:hypothetical protein